MVVGESKRTANIMDGIENTGDVRMHDHRLRLKQRFDIVRKLGQGTYGKVQLGINKKTGQEVAIKTIKKCKIESEADLIRIRREVQIMSSVRHPNIVHIYEVFENTEKMILVMEYCSGGELYDYLSQKKVLQEDEARRLFRQIATAVYYCHIHKICHRDLKLENVLLDDTGSAKIADFGLSNVFKETSLLSTFCGSPLYASPEIVKGTPYIGPEVDCWSLGVLLYTLVYGAMPFDGSNFKRLVRQISNGDYYEPRNPSSASPLIRDMLTVDPLKRADIAYICDHPWVNSGCEASCLEVAEALAAETPVRLDLLLSLAPAAPSHSNSVVVPPETDLGPEESCTDLTTSASMAIEPSNSAEKRILELVAEGGEDAIKPSPTRTIVSLGENKRKLELAMSASGLQRKKERAASTASIAAPQPALPEEAATEVPLNEESPIANLEAPSTLKSSATMTISPAPVELSKDSTKVLVMAQPEDQEKERLDTKPRTVTRKKVQSAASLDEKSTPEKLDTKNEVKTNLVTNAAEKLTSLSIAQSPSANQTAAKPKKLSIPGGNVGSFKDQFERRASMTSAPDIKRNISKPVVSKIAKPKAQSEDRELTAKSPDNGTTVRLQQIGIEPSPSLQTSVDDEPNRGGVKKTESEPTHGAKAVDPSVLLQDARRSLQNSMAKLVEEKAGEESRRRAARDIISSAIRTGKPPMPYGRSSSAGVAGVVGAGAGALSSPPGTPPLPPHSAPTAPNAAPPFTSSQPRVFRTEAQHRVEDHRNRGVSVERIIPIHMAQEDVPTSPPPVQPKVIPSPTPRVVTQPALGRLASTESTASESCLSPGEPIKKSAREFIIPIAVEGKGYVTPRQRSLEPEAQTAPRHRPSKPRRLSSLASGGESEEEEEAHMHRLRPSRAARADSLSSGEDDEEDEGFHLLTADNLFSTLLHRVRALTQRLNGEEGPGFPQHAHSLFNNMQSPFFNSAHLPRRNLLREGWGSRDLHADLDSMFGKATATAAAAKARPHMPRGSSKKLQKNQTKTDETEGPIEESGLDLSDLDLSSIQFSEKEMRALSGLTPALSRRLQRQLLAHLPPHAARTLRRTLSLHAPEQRAGAHDAFVRSHSASKSLESDRPRRPHADADSPDDPAASPHEANLVPPSVSVPAPAPAAVSPPPVQCSTLPRLRRRSTPRTEPPTSTSPSPSPEEASVRLRGTAERPLLSKYLTPERHLSVDEPFVSDSGSVLSEPPYGAAYGSSAAGSVRRSSLRLPNEQPKKRLSRFLRSDFFDTPPEESLYAKHKKEKELETQKILREIREKRNRALEASASKSLEIVDAPVLKDDVIARKSLSPVGASPIRERSRSNTPFFPILDNIKETNLDTPLSRSALKSSVNLDNSKQKSRLEDSSLSKETRLIRPKSYPVKTLDCIEEPSEEVLSDNLLSKENNEKSLATKESKLIRPKSYPTSSPSPEKVYLKPNFKKPENETQKEEVPKNEIKTDVEVSFSITLPKKTKVDTVSKTDSVKLSDLPEQTATQNDEIYKKTNENVLVLKKYQVVDKNDDKELSDKKLENGKLLTNGDPSSHINVSSNEEIKIKLRTQTSKSKDDVKAKPSESDIGDKKIVKKKIIRKVSSKSKTDLGGNTETEPKTTNEKKKVTKKVKDKNTDDDASKAAGVAKKKSVLQTISHKLEKLASAKSNSPEKTVNEEIKSKKDISKLNRMQREQSVPVNVDPPITESNLIKRAVTLTDVAALENENTTQNKTTVSKVLGLFKKFEPKEKPKPIIQKSQSEHTEENINTNSTEPVIDISLENINKDKVRRPTSLLLNGLGRKAKNAKGATDNVPAKSSTDNVSLCTENEDHTVLKIDETKNLRNSLKLDLSRLPRVKKIVPTNPVIEPQMMNVSPEDCEFEKKEKMERSSINLDGNTNLVSSDSHSRSRSRSRSTISNSELNSSEAKSEKNPISPSDNTLTYPLRNHDSTTPEKDDLIDRIRRKSFYSRFNEKKQRRKSSLVGPGATEYDPLAIIHGAGGVGGETKPEPSFTLISPVSPISPLSPFSPISPAAYDLSPGLSASSDLSPSTERYRSLLTDTPGTARTHLRFDNYGVNDKIDTYRSLDRNDFRKYPGSRSYLDYDQPSSYGTMRYSRTKSLLESPDGSEDNCLTNSLRDPHKYNRTISMYSPGNYATYRPRTRNPAIILKESEKEPSPENILEKIKQRKKISISVTRKPDPEKETLPRSTITPKGESDGAECSEKVD